jgi:hypothetical protein
MAVAGSSAINIRPGSFVDGQPMPSGPGGEPYKPRSTRTPGRPILYGLAASDPGDQDPDAPPSKAAPSRCATSSTKIDCSPSSNQSTPAVNRLSPGGHRSRPEGPGRSRRIGSAAPSAQAAPDSIVIGSLVRPATMPAACLRALRAGADSIPHPAGSCAAQRAGTRERHQNQDHDHAGAGKSSDQPLIIPVSSRSYPGVLSGRPCLWLICQSH